MLLARDSPQNKRPTKTESGGLEKIFQENEQEKKQQQQYLHQTKQTSKQRP